MLQYFPIVFSVTFNCTNRIWFTDT